MCGVNSFVNGPLLGGELKAEKNDIGEDGSSGEDLLRLRVISCGMGEESRV